MVNEIRQIEIRVKGQIDRNWSCWVSGFNISHNLQGETVLTGHVRDQAELRGILSKLADLGLELISVTTNPQRIRKSLRAGGGE